MVDPSIADAHTGHGIVMPQCHHGGPGRAGNGEELGGLNGLRLYHQRVAVQGSTELLADAAGERGAAALKPFPEDEAPELVKLYRADCCFPREAASEWFTRYSWP